MENSYKFYKNDACKYFPCHENIDKDKFNCMFCFCPLYFLEEKCGGNFKYYGKIKDCSQCTIPHCEKGYEIIVGKIKEVNENKKK